MRRLVCAGILGLWSLGGCDCGPGTQNVLPWLVLDEASLDFGPLALDDTGTQTLRLAAGTSADVQLTITLEDDSGHFTLDPPPTLIPGSGTADVVIRFTPTRVDTFVATLDVKSNDPDVQRGNKRILLSGQGMSPRVEVLPVALSLGAIACPPRSAPPPACVDQDAVTLRSTGEVPLTLGEIVLRGRDGAPLPENLRLMTLDASGATLEPDETLAIAVRWAPSSAEQPSQVGTFEAELVVPSNDPEHPETVIPLTLIGLPNSPPQACIRVKDVTRRRIWSEFNPATGAYEVRRDPAFPVRASEYVDPADPARAQVRPGMTVRLQADPTCTSDPDEDPLSYVWSIGPTGSGLTVTPSGSPPTEARVSELIDPGQSEVTLVVSDSVNPPVVATFVLDAIPRDDLYLQLGWPDPSAANVDLDLHLILDEGPNVSGPGDLFCLQDCFSFHTNPRWFEDAGCFDGDPGTPCVESLANDPLYELDDLGGGPRVETMSLAEVPFGSRLRVAVHYFGGDEKAVTPVIRGRLKGVEFGPLTPEEPLDGIGDVWFGAELTFPAEVPETDPPTPQPPPFATGTQARTTRPGVGEYDGSVGLCLP